MQPHPFTFASTAAAGINTRSGTARPFPWRDTCRKNFKNPSSSALRLRPVSRGVGSGSRASHSTTWSGRGDRDSARQGVSRLCKWCLRPGHCDMFAVDTWTTTTEEVACPGQHEHEMRATDTAWCCPIRRVTGRVRKTTVGHLTCSR